MNRLEDCFAECSMYYTRAKATTILEAYAHDHQYNFKCTTAVG